MKPFADGVDEGFGTWLVANTYAMLARCAGYKATVYKDETWIQTGAKWRVSLEKKGKS